MFIVEFAPAGIRRVLEPVVRLLAAVPSVIYGLIGILVVVKFFNDHLITQSAKDSVAGVAALNGFSWGVGALILTVMITPLTLGMHVIEAIAEGIANAVELIATPPPIAIPAPQTGT